MLWDEITRAPSDAFNLILPLMDRQEYMSLDESEDGSVIYKGKAVSFMATANVGVEYTGTMALDRALLDRFKVKIDLDYPPQAEEERIIRLRFPTVPTGEIKKLVKIAASQRSLAVEGEYNTMISTRMLLDCCEMLNDSVSRKAAIEASIFGCFEKEGGEDSERVKVIQIFQKESYM